jgi:hypothetical protein
VRIARIGSWAVAAVIGLLYGAPGPSVSPPVGPVPLGLIVAVAGTGALLLAVRLLTGDRWAALAGLGVMLTTLVLLGRGPGGSVVCRRRRR